MSDVTTSATDNGYSITPKYHAPENTNMLLCDWPEDVFTLGCIYLETAYRLLHPGPSCAVGPWAGQQSGWSFQAHLPSMDLWLTPLQLGGLAPSHLASVIRLMMALEPVNRPDMRQLIRQLDFIESLSASSEDTAATRLLFGPCCQQNDPSTQLHVGSLEATVEPVQGHERGLSVTSDATDFNSDVSVDSPASQLMVIKPSTYSLRHTTTDLSSHSLPFRMNEPTVVPVVKKDKFAASSSTENLLQFGVIPKSKEFNLPNVQDLDDSAEKDLEGRAMAQPRKYDQLASISDNDNMNRFGFWTQASSQSLQPESSQQPAASSLVGNIESESRETFDQLRRAWLVRFGSFTFELSQHDPRRLQLGKILGTGYRATVHESVIDGILFALKVVNKTTYLHRLVALDSDVTGLTFGYHAHVGNIFGCYYIEVGPDINLAIWPRGVGNLAKFLRSIDTSFHGAGVKEPGVIQDLFSRDGRVLSTANPGGKSHIHSTHSMAVKRLQQMFGCIASAVEWLHRDSFRHAAIESSNLILSGSGVWLSGLDGLRWGTDYYHRGNSRCSTKYISPESVKYERPGMPEDVFQLGCTFHQITYRLARHWYLDLQHFSLDRPGRPWPYNTSSGKVSSWLKQLGECADHRGPFFSRLIEDMLATRPDDRPSMSEVLTRLSTYHDEQEESDIEILFFCSICKPPIARDTYKHDPKLSANEPDAGDNS